MLPRKAKRKIIIISEGENIRTLLNYRIYILHRAYKYYCQSTRRGQRWEAKPQMELSENETGYSAARFSRLLHCKHLVEHRMTK